MTKTRVSAVVLAAGLSTRMGASKLNLPWGDQTVIGAVCSTLVSAGVGEVIVALGGYSREVDMAITALPYSNLIRRVYNHDPMAFGMLGSLKIALRVVDPNCDQILIALGDNPQITIKVVQDLRACAGERIVIPSHKMRRGHPWMISREMVEGLLELPVSATMRDWINSHADQIKYIEAGPEILMDLDTPEDYERQKP